MTELVDGSNDWKIAVTLVEQNPHIPDEHDHCGGDLKCAGISCGECPYNGDSTAVPLGRIREAVGTKSVPTYTGGSADYYQVRITNTTTPGRPDYIAECNDIIEALGMNFAEGNAFKALWRRAAHRTLGLRKAGAKGDGLYDAEKVEFFGARLVAQSKAAGHDSK